MKKKVSMRQQMKWLQEDTDREFRRSAIIKEFWESGGSKFKVPPVQHEGQDWEIRQIEIHKNDPTFLRLLFQGRYSAVGTYTQLIKKNADDGPIIMMTDSPAEIFDHNEVYTKAKEMEAGTALVAGLGLGVVVRMLLTLPHIKHIDVLEISKELIDFFQGSFDEKRVTLYHADVFKKRWPPKKRWDVVWFDIWPFISEKNEKEMNRLNKKYWNRCRWMGFWSKRELEYQRIKTASWIKRIEKET